MLRLFRNPSYGPFLVERYRNASFRILDARKNERHGRHLLITRIRTAEDDAPRAFLLVPNQPGASPPYRVIDEIADFEP